MRFVNQFDSPYWPNKLHQAIFTGNAVCCAVPIVV
jgi:hypothetical protein